MVAQAIRPSGLPAISPSRGEIGRTDIACRIVANRPVPLFGTLFFGKSVRRELISPLVGEMPGKAEGGSAPMAARRLA